MHLHTNHKPVENSRWNLDIKRTFLHFKEVEFYPTVMSYAYESCLQKNLCQWSFGCHPLPTHPKGYFKQSLAHSLCLEFYGTLKITHIPGSAPSNKYGWFVHFRSCMRMLRSLILSDLPAPFTTSMSFIRILVYLRIINTRVWKESPRSLRVTT